MTPRKCLTFAGRAGVWGGLAIEYGVDSITQIYTRLGICQVVQETVEWEAQALRIQALERLVA